MTVIPVPAMQFQVQKIVMKDPCLPYLSTNHSDVTIRQNKLTNKISVTKLLTCKGRNEGRLSDSEHWLRHPWVINPILHATGVIGLLRIILVIFEPFISLHSWMIFACLGVVSVASLRTILGGFSIKIILSYNLLNRDLHWWNEL